MFCKDKQLINLYRPLLKEKLKTGQVVPYLLSLNSDSLPEGTDRNLRAVAKNEPIKAVEELLDALIAHDAPGWFSAFMTALERTGYKYMSELLLGYRDMEDDSFARKLINVFLPDLMNVNCVNIMPYLRQSECITDDDCEAILAFKNNHGERSAALYMIQEHLANKSEDWFPKFITALNASGDDHLAEIIEPKLKNIVSEDSARNITEDMKETNIAQESNNTPRSSHFSMDGRMHETTQLHGQDESGADLSLSIKQQSSNVPPLANKDLPVAGTRGKCMDQTKHIAEVKPIGFEKVLNSSLSDSCPSDEDNTDPKSVSETFVPKDNESKRILVQQNSVSNSHLQENARRKMQDVHMNQLGCETNKSWNIPFSSSVATPKTPIASSSGETSSCTSYFWSSIGYTWKFTWSPA